MPAKEPVAFEESHDYVDQLDACLAAEAKPKELKTIKSSSRADMTLENRLNSFSQKTLQPNNEPSSSFPAAHMSSNPLSPEESSQVPLPESDNFSTQYHTESAQRPTSASRREREKRHLQVNVRKPKLKEPSGQAIRANPRPAMTDMPTKPMTAGQFESMQYFNSAIDKA